MGILKNIFSSKKNLIKKEFAFFELKKNKRIKELFASINEHSNKSEIRYVGGCVRKILFKEKVDDIDLATNLEPKTVCDILKKKNINFYETGIDHGTITAEISGENFEITSLRKDISTDGRRAVVEFTENWHLDAQRRDFTINSIYSDIDGNLFDPFDGKNDLLEGKIRFIGKTENRIKEDYLRILRYIRFFLNYSKQRHDPKVKKIIKSNIDGIKSLSKERLLDELKKLVLSPGFLKINEDDFSLEIITILFPQLKNLYLFKNLNKYTQEILKSKDFIFLISLMIIDNTDNSDYFIYKFKLSNNEKRKIKFLNKIFSEKIENKFFSKQNLTEIFYHNNKDLLFDIIDFQIFKSKKIDKKLIKIKEFFNLENKPVFPINGNDLIKKYNLKEGKELGDKLKLIENIWIKNGFKISDQEVDKMFNN